MKRGRGQPSVAALRLSNSQQARFGGECFSCVYPRPQRQFHWHRARNKRETPKKLRGHDSATMLARSTYEASSKRKQLKKKKKGTISSIALGIVHSVKKNRGVTEDESALGHVVFLRKHGLARGDCTANERTAATAFVHTKAVRLPSTIPRAGKSGCRRRRRLARIPA